MNRINYIYEFVGRIVGKKPKKKRDGGTFWQLSTIIKDQNIDKINVFSNALKNPQIWSEIEATNYLDRTYHFYCKNFMGRYFLVDWKELNNSSSEKELKNHGSH